MLFDSGWVYVSRSLVTGPCAFAFLSMQLPVVGCWLTEAGLHVVSHRNPRPSVDEAKVASLFSHYAEEGEEGEDPFVGSSGIVRLCEDIGVDAGTDLVALVIAQQMNAAAFLRFEAAEWRQGFFNLG